VLAIESSLIRFSYFVYSGFMLVFLFLYASHDPVKHLVVKVICALLAIAMMAMVVKWRVAKWIALVSFLPAMGRYLVSVGERIGFIFAHGGLSCDYCKVSPARFLETWVVESIVSIPAFLFFFWLLRQRERALA
jgi:hypothetical protein